MANTRSNSIGENEFPLMDNNTSTQPFERFSSDEDEVIPENKTSKLTGYYPIGTDSEEEPLLQEIKEQESTPALVATLIHNLNQRDYQDNVQYIQSLELTRNDFYGYAQGLMNKIDLYRKAESLTPDQKQVLSFAESMATEVYLMQHEFHDDHDTKFAPALIGLNCAINALENPLNEDNISKLGELYNDVQSKPELGSSSLGYKIAGGLLIGLGILAMAACITLAVASAGILTPATLAGMGFVGGIITAGVSMLGGAATAALGTGITTGALSTTIGIGCAISGSELGFARSTHGLFNCTSTLRNKLNPEGFDWKSSVYTPDSKEMEPETIAMALS